MTTFVRILTTHTLDSSPCVMLSSPNGDLTMINCGEGCQRSFLESTGLRAKSVKRLCLTHLSHSAVGGLPGMVLTTADVAAEASKQLATNKQQKKATVSAPSIENNSAVSQKSGGLLHKPHNDTAGSTDNSRPKSNNKRKTSTTLNAAPPEQSENLSDLDIMGPRGTRHFMHALRHFMRRDAFRLNIKEGGSFQPKSQTQGSKRQKIDAKEGFHVQSIPCTHRLSSKGVKLDPRNGTDVDVGINVKKQAPTTPSSDESTGDNVEVLSFVFTTPPIPGKLLPDKANELGVPRGPLFRQLKNGEAVTFEHPVTKKSTTVESHEVVTTGSPGAAVAVLYCPSLSVLQQVINSPVLSKLTETRLHESKTQPMLELVIHMAPVHVFEAPPYQSWITSLPKAVEHVFMQAPTSIVDVMPTIEKWSSPSHAATLGAMTRSLLHEGIFPPVVSSSDDRHAENGRKHTTLRTSENPKSITGCSVIDAAPDLEYILVPLSKKGFMQNSIVKWESPTMIDGVTEAERDEMKRMADQSGALNLAKSIRNENSESPVKKGDACGELVFTGTGSAIPCKHRNVTGMFLRMDNGNAMLLDIGENTIGQLLRVKHHQHDKVNSNDADGLTLSQDIELLRSIKAVWISHPHADHHLGLLRLLSERNSICGPGVDPIVLMAPVNMFRFLSEYSIADPRIKDSYIALDCSDMVPGKRNPLGDKLYSDLGITYCVSVPVAHCAHSYAVVVDGTPFGRVTYSGDCRPSNRFADVGIHADLLIHEATFEDGMEEDAALKRHCTVSEALGIGHRMNAKAVVLTHFSQRYPRIPPLKTDDTNLRTRHNTDGVPVVFAFDFMTLTPQTVKVASRLTPALRLLYPENSDQAGVESANGVDGSDITAKEILSVPGLFAKSGFL